jgi:hypothetical protein
MDWGRYNITDTQELILFHGYIGIGPGPEINFTAVCAVQRRVAEYEVHLRYLISIRHHARVQTTHLVYYEQEDKEGPLFPSRCLIAVLSNTYVHGLHFFSKRLASAGVSDPEVDVKSAERHDGRSGLDGINYSGRAPVITPGMYIGTSPCTLNSSPCVRSEP